MNQTAALLETALEEVWQAEEFPSLAAVLAEGPDIRWQHAVGYADLAAQTPASVETVYRIGSITKLFTALALLAYEMLDLWLSG